MSKISKSELAAFHHFKAMLTSLVGQSASNELAPAPVAAKRGPGRSPKEAIDNNGAVVKSKKIRLGRPKVYTGELLAHVKYLLQHYGITQTQHILAARRPNREPVAENSPEYVSEYEAACYRLRDKHVCREPRSISTTTLVKISKKARIKQTVGRPRLDNVA